MILEDLKRGDKNYPIIVDAGIGTASDAATAMELGADGVLLNTAVAKASSPVGMSIAMKMAVEAGKLARMSGRIARSKYGCTSSPEYGMISKRS